MTKRQLIALENKCYQAERALNEALSNLANAASSILGFEVVADLCSSNEIEFRRVYGDRTVDDYDTIRIEEILSKL